MFPIQLRVVQYGDDKAVGQGKLIQCSHVGEAEAISAVNRGVDKSLC